MVRIYPHDLRVYRSFAMSRRGYRIIWQRYLQGRQVSRATHCTRSAERWRSYSQVTHVCLASFLLYLDNTFHYSGTYGLKPIQRFTSVGSQSEVQAEKIRVRTPYLSEPHI
jgi:hypothetical protein